MRLSKEAHGASEKRTPNEAPARLLRGRSTSPLAGTMSPAAPLREAVKLLFYPFAESKGFARAKSRSSLLTLFRRATTDSMQLFEIQWEKYNRPSFVVNFSEGPIGGLEVRGAPVAAADLEPYHCPTLGRLKPRNCPYLRCWFRTRKPWTEVLRSRAWTYTPEEVTMQLIALFPELEAWWAEKREGPHLHFTRRAG